MPPQITHQQAKRLANEHLRAEGSPWVATHATRQQGVWVVSYGDPDEPDQRLDGGGLVVTDDGSVYNLSSVPGSLDDLLMGLGRSPLNAVWEREGESLALLADIDPEEAAGLAAWAASRRPPWPVLEAEGSKTYFRDLMRFIDDERRKHRGEVYPTEGDVFQAFRLTPFDKVRVVILGQDPYPNPGQATGLAFSVPKDLRPLPRSLVNIHAAMRHDGFTPPEHGDLTAWAQQGVFLLNTALTVSQGGKPNHLTRWKPFTEAVIRLLSQREQPVVFVLWGAKARKWKKYITNAAGRVIEAPHPASWGPPQVQFQDSRTFSEVNTRLAQFGGSEINWSST